MNVFLRATFGIGGIILYSHIRAMDGSSMSGALKLIEQYNGKNIGEITIDPSRYLAWLECTRTSQETDSGEGTTAHSDSSEESVEQNILEKQELITLSTFYRTLRLVPINLSSHSSNETIMRKIIYTLNATEMQYGPVGLKPLWLKLKKHVDHPRLNSLLDTIICATANHYYRLSIKRDLIAICVCAGADANRRRKRDGLSILGEAVLNDDIPAVSLLLDHNANPNTHLANDLHAPLIWYAHNKAIIQLLIQYGAQMPHANHLSACDQERYEQLLALFHEYKNGQSNY